MTQARILIGSIIIALVVLLGAIGWVQWKAAKGARQRAVTAEAATEVAKATTEVVDRYHTNTVVIQKEAVAAEASVRAVEGAGTELSPERVTALCEGLATVRGREACG